MVYFFYPKFTDKKIEIWRLWLPYVSRLGLSKGARFRNILLTFKIISELGVFPFKSSWQLQMILKYHVRWWLLWKLHEYMKHAKPVTTSDVAALWLCWLTHLFFWKIFLSLFYFSKYMQIILIIQEISFWNDSFLWNAFSDLEQKILVEIQPGTISYYKYILFILHFCGSTNMWKEAKREKLNPWAGIMFILQL